MKKLTATLGTAALLAGATLATAAPATAGTDKVTICHATGKDGKYVEQTISKDGTANGHAGTSHQDGRDIIPAYSWIDNGTRYYFDGQNLEQGRHLLTNGCESPAAPFQAAPNAPTYVPATCAAPSLPYGRVVVPKDLGAGVASATEPTLNADKASWSLSYSLEDNTEDIIYTWLAGTTGAYNFQVVPLTADPNYVVDSRTGVGACELPETGAEGWMIAGGAGLAVLAAGGLMVAASRRRTA